MCRAITIGLIVALGSACAGQLPAPVHTTPSNPFASLVLDSPLGAAPDEDVLALPTAVSSYIEEAIQGKSTTIQRVNALAALFVTDGGLGMRYEMMADGTAAETFESRVGSCLSYTHLYIAMARSIGIDARYREIIAVPRWEVIGEFAVLNRHVAAYGEVPLVGSYVMDFGLLDENERQYGRVISDQRARAQHFNNRGARALAEGDTEQAVRYFNRGLMLDPELSFIWANLGTALMRLRQFDRAEQALRQSLALRTYEVTALNQLARLYDLMGRSHLAEAFRKRAQSVRHQNPYMLFQQARAARAAGEYRDAIGLLRRAVRAQPDEVHFYIELGRVFRDTGQIEKARQAFLDAHERITSIEERAALLEALRVPVMPAGRTEEPQEAPTS